MDVDINDFHCSLYHVHEGLLRETAKQRNVNLTGTLRQCQGCSIAKGTREAHRYDNRNTSRRGREGSKTVKFRSEEVETAGVQSNESGKDQVDVWSEGSDSKPVNVEVGDGESEDEDEELYIFPQCAPAPAPAPAPKGRAAQLPSLTPAASSEGRAASPAPLTTADVSGGRVTPVTVVSVNEGYGPVEFEGSRVSSSPSVGCEGSDRVLNEDAQESPVPSTRGTETGKAIPPLVLGGREAARLKWTAESPAGTVEGRTRGDVRRLQAFHGAALVVREMGMEAVLEYSVFLGAHYSYVGTLSGLEDKFLIEGAADIAFQMETQKIANFLDGLESAGKTDGAFLSVFETTVGSEIVCLHVCDDVAFATSEEFGLAAVEDITIGRISEVEEPQLRVGDVKYKNFRGMWEDAMMAEYKGLVGLNAFEFVDVVPDGVNVISALWVFAWKIDKDGNIVQPKARLVGRGFSQVHTVDFFETYVPTPAASSAKLLVANAVKNDRELRRLDVKQAFIQADLDFNVFMKLPDGCGDKSGKVVKLSEPVYGLKQAGRRWAMHLGDAIVRKIGMEQCKTSLCFQLIRDGVVVMTVCVHVDDITVAVESEACGFLSTCPLEEFQTTGGELSLYIGCAFERDKKEGVLSASQRASIESVVSRYGVDAVSDLPASQSADLDPRRNDEPVCDKPVRAAVGSLIWLGGMTRPDIANAVRAVVRQAHDPAERHWRAVRKLIAYLNKTKDLGLVLVKDDDRKLSVYVHADHANKDNDRRSVSGVAVMVGGTVVNASSTTQHCLTLSTREAEYVAMAQGAKTALFTKAVLDFLQPQFADETIDVFEDDQGAIAIAENPISGGRTKNIDVRYHFIRELVERKVLNIQYTESSNQHADILTKPRGLEAFARHRSFLMNLPEWLVLFLSFGLKVGSCKGCFSGEGVLSRKAGLSSLSNSELLFEKTAQDVHW